MIGATMSIATGARIVRMAGGRAPSWLAALALLAPCVVDVDAEAQSVGYVGPGGSCTPAARGCATDEQCFEESGGETDTCDELDVGGRAIRVCRPALSALCCTGPVSADIACPDGLACVERVVGSLGICVPEDANDCGGDAEQIGRCHTSPDGGAPVAYEYGDCDADLVPNGIEETVGTDPCSPPPPRLGVWIAHGGAWQCAPTGTCESLDEPCDVGGSGDGRCAANDRTGDGAPICSVPPDLFCCGTLAGMECPQGECVLPEDVDDGAGFCTDPSLLCGHDEESLVACHTSPSGKLATIENGDCDRDGLANAHEKRMGRDPCTAERPPDAGTIQRDGGVKPNDGGPGGQRDASQGPPVAVEFGGGGGCACRASWGALGLRPIAIVLALLLVVAVRPRR